jgi:ligand-binding sensor domain-containing protein
MAIGPSLRTGRLTAAAAAANGQGWFIGTSTRGLLFVDRMTVLADPMPLGIGGESVGALALVGDGIWVTTDAGFDGLPAALTYLHENLGTAIRLEGNPAMGLPFSASRRVLPGDRVVWVGSDRGLVRVPIDGDSPELYGEGSGLPIPLVTALIQWREQVVVGTMRGLAIYDSTGLNRTAPGVIDAIRTLATRGDTLWVGGDFGLGAMLIGDTTVRVSTGWRRLTSQRIPVYGIGYVMDTMVVLSQDRVIWRDPSTGAWTPGPLLGAALGPLHTMFATDAGVWVGGDRGAALVLLNAGPIRTLTVGADLPGAVRAIAANDRYLWIGTIDGLVRLKLR